MDFGFEYARSISNFQEFLKFLEKLESDLANNKDEWENPNLEMYLNSMYAWVEDTSEFGKQPSWSYIATMLYAASRYE